MFFYSSSVSCKSRNEFNKGFTGFNTTPAVYQIAGHANNSFKCHVSEELQVKKIPSFSALMAGREVRETFQLHVDVRDRIFVESLALFLWNIDVPGTFCRII